jgi:hypothetical protein
VDILGGIDAGTFSETDSGTVSVRRMNGLRGRKVDGTAFGQYLDRCWECCLILSVIEGIFSSNIMRVRDVH